MVPESIIEAVIEHYSDNDQEYVDDLTDIMETQPTLLAFLNQESIDILLEEEKDILWYIVLVIYTSAQKHDVELAEISENILSENEEKNWTILQEQPRGSFREKATVFFTNYHQEDLLAFVEDTVELDESSPISNVGREVIFITAKSIIDTILPKK